MFDVYLQEQTIDPATRWRMLVAMAVASAAIAATGTAAVVADKLSVSAVSAPTLAQTLTLVTEPTPPRAPKPPARPEPPAVAGGGGGTPEHREPAKPAAPLQSDPGPASTTRSGPVGPGPQAGVPGIGGPGGPLPGPGMDPIGTCVVPPCGERGTTTRRPTPPPQVPLSRIKALARYAPDPDPKALARTPTGRGTRRSGDVTIAFCIDEAGKVDDVRTTRGFGDREVDAIARHGVESWRFSPMIVGGRAQRTCSQVTFSIRFE